MNKLLISAWTVFFIGLAFRILHYPGAGIFSMLGTLLILIHSIMYFNRNVKTDLSSSLLYLSFANITLYILFRIQCWSVGPMFLGFSLFFIFIFLLTIAWAIIHIVDKKPFKIPQIFLILYFVFFIGLSFTNSYKIYYFFNLNTVINGVARNTDYYSWDKYSWFLYIANKQEEAIVANENALKAAEEYLKSTSDEDVVQYLELIKQHKQKIQENNWTNFP